MVKNSNPMDVLSAQQRPLRSIGIAEVARKASVSERTAHDFAKQPWFPNSVDLGSSKIRRWIEHEVDHALASRPRLASTAPEPAQLRRGKIEALKARGVSA